MTRFLASVRDEAEARAVLAWGADIVDLKDPARGALGAVAPGTIKVCLSAVAGQVPVSATVGDLPMEPAIVTQAIAAMDALGVDNVKLGIMPGGEPLACFTALRKLDLRAGLILVFFGDAMAEVDPIEAALSCHACGLMLDTAGKKEGALTDHVSLARIASFIGRARAHGLISGVAGSLRAKHVAPLQDLQPDVMGFRGALCRDGVRTKALDPIACRHIRALIPPHQENTKGSLREPLAPALC